MGQFYVAFSHISQGLKVNKILTLLPFYHFFFVLLCVFLSDLFGQRYFASSARPALNPEALHPVSSGLMQTVPELVDRQGSSSSQIQLHLLSGSSSQKLFLTGATCHRLVRLELVPTIAC